ncbi:MAG: transglutaminase family protein [Acidimicrobiia bacterium]
MSWRLHVRHHTTMRYSGDVFDSYNEARLTPISSDGQRTINHELRVAPRAHAYRYFDYWGTVVHAFDVHEPHDELDIVADSEVVTQPHSNPPEILPSWGEVARHADRFYELVSPSQFTDINEVLRADAQSCYDPQSVLTTATNISERTREILQYEKGATRVDTTAIEARAAGRGVCQDFVHVSLAQLRSLGIPARYVSGYLYPATDAPLGAPVTGESHAWLEAWVGDWVAFDPTNGSQVDERHVVVARGRDYGDVTPLKGVFRGSPSDSLTVSVTLTRLA